MRVLSTPTRPRFVVGVVAVGIIAGAAAVLYGWHTGSQILVRGGMSGVPVQYNTAAAFAVTGLALLLIAAGATRTGAVLGLPLLAIGLLTLFQYMTGIDVALDRALFEPWHVARRAYPGRMAPQSALGFLGIGAGLLSIRRAPLVGSSLAIAIVVLGTLTLAGYLMSVRTTFAWGGATPIALVAAVGMIAAGGCLAMLVSPQLAVDRPGGPWIAYVAGAACLLGAVSFAGAITQQRDHLIDRVLAEALKGLSREVRSQVRRHSSGLQHLETRLPSLDDGFRACRATSRLLMRTPKGPAAIEWIDRDLHTRRRVISRESPEAAAQTHGLDAAERAAFRAHETRDGTFTTPPRALQDGRVFFRIAIPVHGRRSKVGFVSAVFFLDEFLQSVVGAERPLYDLTITAGRRAIFTSGPGGDPPPWQTTAEVELPGAIVWFVTIAPSRSFEAFFDTGLSEFVLAAGLLLAVLVSTTIRGWQRVDLQRRALVETNQVLREEVERHRREADARISAEDRLRLVHHSSPGHAHRRQHLEEDLRRFASFVSHELRQPLASMGIFVKLLESRVAADDTSGREYVDELRTNVDRMASSIEGQLALVRMVTSEEDASFESVIDLNAVLVDASAGLAAQLDEIDATITVAPLAAILGNPQQVEQVFRNLIENAIKYRHPERPLTITIDGARIDDAMYEVRVADNGTGFPPEDAPAMFTMFHRLDPARATGSGLGLALCRRIVERHGGAIRGEGRPDEGATLYVSFPLARDRAA
jgi:signal transduction histidine kinase